MTAHEESIILDLGGGFEISRLLVLSTLFLQCLHLFKRLRLAQSLLSLPDSFRKSNHLNMSQVIPDLLRSNPILVLRRVYESSAGWRVKQLFQRIVTLQIGLSHFEAMIFMYDLFDFRSQIFERLLDRIPTFEIGDWTQILIVVLKAILTCEILERRHCLYFLVLDFVFLFRFIGLQFTIVMVRCIVIRDDLIGINHVIFEFLDGIWISILQHLANFLLLVLQWIVLWSWLLMWNEVSILELLWLLVLNSI